MSEKGKKYNVAVLSRDEITTYPKLGVPMITVLVTYVGAGLPPHTVRIPKDNYTPDAEKKLIRASIDDRVTKRSESFEV